ncbi:hypothetical protein [Deinococcus marmoris]|uniref:Uncharacterized protein n=1 Tax=Deinococcus marmoris TaxID=249408 RepID=A0A1U7NY44_9DEIO|nr:hypothetical protein [Deinococcus marmoris]OLV17838.1 hypothetical protein BOO71_0007663 [Deinococcus marmoris]
MTQISDLNPASRTVRPSAEMEKHTPPIQTQISDRPEPMPLWLAWGVLALLIALAAFTLYLYVTTQYVPER